MPYPEGSESGPRSQHAGAAAGEGSGRSARPHTTVRSLTDRRGVGWRTGEILRAVVLTVGTIAVMRGLWAASTVLLVVFLGVLFGLALTAGVDRLAKLRVPRALGAALIVVTVIGTLVVVGGALAPTLAEQVQEIEARLPVALRSVSQWVSDLERSAMTMFSGRHATSPQAPGGAAPPARAPGPAKAPGAPAAPGAAAAPPTTGGPSGDSVRAGGAAGGPSSDVVGQLTQGVTGVSRVVFGFLGDTVEVVASVLLMLFLAIYVAADPGLYHRGIMHLFPHRMRARAGDVLSAMASVLRKWLMTQVIAMITLGVVWAIALLVLGVRAAIALGVIAGLLEFIPTIGPTMAVLPALAMAALDSPAKALSVLGVYLAIQALESNVLIPMLMQGQIDLPPALTIVGQALMTLAFGFLGLMVAVPVLAAVMVPIKLLYVEDVVGDMVMDDNTHDTDAAVAETAT